MSDKKTSVFAIYTEKASAERGVRGLMNAGFTATAISVLLPENLGTRELGTEKATKAPEGATAGAGTGAVLGGALGLLAGVGALAIPGVGPLIAAGPIMATLAGIGVGGTVGGFAGALIGAGIPEYEAKLYEGFLQKGGILVSVHCSTSEEIDRAKHELKATGGQDIASSGEGSARKDRSRERAAGRQ
jgi:hypothetical protein